MSDWDEDDKTFEYGKVVVIKVTDQAILCVDAGALASPKKGDDGFWVPLSQISEDSEVPDVRRGVLVVSEWLANERGWL